MLIFLGPLLIYHEMTGCLAAHTHNSAVFILQIT